VVREIGDDPRPRSDPVADGHNLTDERPPVAESELGDAQYYRIPSRRIELSLTRRF